MFIEICLLYVIKKTLQAKKKKKKKKKKKNLSNYTRIYECCYILSIIEHYQIYILKVNMPILTCIFFTFNWLKLTSNLHFVKFHPEVASCLLSRGKKESMHPWGWGYYENTQEIIFWYTNKLHIFCHISKTTKNLKLKFYVCN